MSNTNNGGPAFPTLLQEGNMARAEGGLTLRDYFAAKAMQGLLSDPDITGGKEEFAKHAYEIADAMLAERKKGAAK